MAPGKLLGLIAANSPASSFTEDRGKIYHRVPFD